MWYAIVADANYSGLRRIACLTQDKERALASERQKYEFWGGSRGNVEAIGPYDHAWQASQAADAHVSVSRRVVFG